MDFIIKSFFRVFFCGFFLFITPVFLAAANISTVGYVHDTILSQKGITIPIDTGVNRTQPHSVKYLMRQIDRANVLLYGHNSTYANDASKNLVEKNKIDHDVNLLIAPAPFKITTKATADSFSFQLSAKGTWSVNWGDGDVETITKYDTNDEFYSHGYQSPAAYTITITGKATGYGSGYLYAAIKFKDNTTIDKIEGSLGSAFQTVSGVNPIFESTFENTSIRSIPSDLFKGITGAPIANMFKRTFAGTQISSIPYNLFDSVVGSPAKSVYEGTFENCQSLTKVPGRLFDNLYGTPSPFMFYSTFIYCSSLEFVDEDIEGLFNNISGAPAESMFAYMFAGSALSEFPYNLFSGISGAPAEGMFAWTFYDCNNLTSEIPGMLFGNIYGAPAPYMFDSTFSGCTGLSGIIPGDLFSNLSGAPAKMMFWGTFAYCSNLFAFGGNNFFGDINGAPAEGMFGETFTYCTGLIDYIPQMLFGTLYGAPAKNMFNSTFAGCAGLQFYSVIWDITGLNNENVQGMFDSMFSGCSSLTGPVPTLSFSNTTNLWDYFTMYSGGNMFWAASSLWGYEDIPSNWK